MSFTTCRQPTTVKRRQQLARIVHLILYHIGKSPVYAAHEGIVMTVFCSHTTSPSPFLLVALHNMRTVPDMGQPRDNVKVPIFVTFVTPFSRVTKSRKGEMPTLLFMSTMLLL